MCKVLDVKKRNCYSESQTMVKKGHKLLNKFCFLTQADKQYKEQEHVFLFLLCKAIITKIS